MYVLLVLGLLLPTVCSSSPTRPHLDIFILPHSHCDAGYKKTVDGYYYTEVRNVLNSVASVVPADPEKRFVWAETVYLERWLQDTTVSSQLKKDLRRAVGEGQIEIVGGGWVMHDEAITSFSSQIAQVSLGHSRLPSLLGFRPNIRTGYQIDPFGPSSFSPTFMSRAGMSAVIDNRVPDDVKAVMRKNKELEFVWEGSPQIGNSSRVLYHVYDTHYAAPDGFDWEDQVVYAPPVTSDNVRERSLAFAEVCVNRSTFYATPLLLLPWGSDFRYVHQATYSCMAYSYMAYIHSVLIHGSTHICFSSS